MSRKFIFAFAMLAAFGFAFAANAQVTSTYKSSPKAQIMDLQEALNACNDAGLVQDGIWGSKTLAAIKAFQRDNGLSVDGIVGPNTASALNDCISFDFEDGTPATPTEALCPNGRTLASNCTVAPAAPVAPTEPLCPNGRTLASNCTMAPATPGTPTVVPGVLTGPEGNLTNIAKLGSYNSTKVTESEMDIAVYGIEMVAKDGDQKIDGLNVAFYNSGTGSAKFTRYASEVSVWLDGVEIGRKMTSSFSDDSGDVYTYRFSGMNGIIRKDQKSQLVVKVSAVASMDSSDATNEAWQVEAGTVIGSNTNYISAASANGRYRDFGGDLAVSTIDFQKAGGTSSDQKFKVTTASTNPVARTVQVSSTSDTNDVTLLSFDAKAENAAMVLQKLPVTLVTTDGTSDGVAPYTNAIVKTLYLYANGTKIDAQSVPQDGTDSASETIIFGNTSKLGYKIGNNQTVTFQVRADLNDTENTGLNASDFDNGDKVSASFSSTNMTNATVELDNYNQDTVSNRSGSATGEDQTLRSNGLQVTMGTATTEATANNDGEILNRTITIPVTVTAFDETMYVSQVAENAATASGTNAIAFTLEDSAGATKTITNSATWTSTDATVESSAYRIDAGATRNFKLTVVLTGATGEAQKQYRVQMNQVNGWTDSALSTGQSLQTLSPANSFESPFYTLNLN